MDKNAHEANRESWNLATQRHNSHKGDQAAFFRSGGNTLYPEEVELLGQVRDQRLVHLQCNSGQDTLSLVAHHAVEATGVDISDEAINFATKLSADTGIPANFIRSDIFDWFSQNDEQFDIVFMSYGTLGWLSDIDRWGAGVASALKPGGRFVIVEFHPAMGILDHFLGDDWSQGFDYMGGREYSFDEGVGDYVGASEGALSLNEGADESGEYWENPKPSHEYSWGIADVVNALLKAGLQLKQLREYPYSNGFKAFPEMVALPGKRFDFGPEMSVVPLMYGIEARKP